MNKNNSRVLHVVLSTQTGGMEQVVRYLAVGSVGQIGQVSVACLQSAGVLSEIMAAHGVYTTVVPAMLPGVSMLFPRALIRVIRESECNIVHVHSGCWAKVAAACWFIPGVRLIYTEHGRAYPELADRVVLDRLSAKRTHTIVAVSDDLREYLVNVIRLPKERVITIRNGVDTVRFRPVSEKMPHRGRLGFDGSEFVIGTVARLAPVKNHLYLLRAVSLVRERCPRVRLVIVGDGPEREHLESSVDALGLREIVRFMGDRSDVEDLMRGFDVFTLPSKSEGTSLTVLEAMATGIPIVATPVGSNSTLVIDDVTGYLVPLDDTREYAERILALAGCSEKRAAMGKRARDLVVAEWSLERMTEAYRDLYESCMVN